MRTDLSYFPADESIFFSWELTAAIFLQMSGLSAFILRASAGARLCWGVQEGGLRGGEGVMGDAMTGGWVLASSYLMLSGACLNPKP